MKYNKLIIFFSVIFIVVISCVLAIFLFKKPIHASIKPTNTVSNTEFELDNATNQADCQFLVMGKNIAGKSYVEFDEAKENVLLPLLAMSHAMGAKIEGDIAKYVEIVFPDETYVLDVSQKLLKVKGQYINIIQKPNKDHDLSDEPVCLQKGNDFIVESRLLEHFLYLRNCRLVVDWKNHIVSIEENETENIKLIVNNKTISSEGIRINASKKYAEIPIVRICKALGAQVKWNGAVASIIFPDDKYKLDIKKFTLYQSGLDFSLLETPVGGMVWSYYRSGDKELFVDSNTLALFFYKIGVSVDVDTESNTVIVETKG